MRSAGLYALPGLQPPAEMVDYAAVLESPLGLLGIRLRHVSTCQVHFLPAATDQKAPDSTPAGRVVDALMSYFSDAHQSMNLPLDPAGTVFQQRVWRSIREIPVGETISYGELALRVGSGARAVANACRRNPLPILVPCHRVVSASGLGGYAGHTDGTFMARKRWLLTHEGVIC